MAARPKPTGAVDRRTAIGDAAIELLAQSGTRGLTHRMVDRHLGIPEGSTGAYHRTRQALLEATAKRVRELDLAEIAEVQKEQSADPDVVRMITTLIVRSGDSDHRSRNLARNVLFMEAANNVELAETTQHSRQGYIGAAEAMLRTYGIEDPELPARALANFMAGLILGQVIYPEPLLSPDEVEQVIQHFLGSYRAA